MASLRIMTITTLDLRKRNLDDEDAEFLAQTLTNNTVCFTFDLIYFHGILFSKSNHCV